MAGALTFRTVAVSTVVLCLSACGGGGGGSGGGSSSYTVGGTVSGLSGSGLVLQNNGGNNLSVAANGSFTFTTAASNAGSYAVTVLTQPSTPSQNCTVSNGSGSIAGANVTSVAISCTTNTYGIGGSVSGLTGTGLVLQNNGGNNLAVAANGSFIFSTPVPSGGNYSVSVSTQPSGQTCTATNASGTVSSTPVSNVTVSCRAQVARFLYVPNSGSNNVLSYSINANTGELTSLGAPVTTDLAPSFLTVDPAEKLLYVNNSGSSSSPPSISGFAINGTTGALTPVPGSPFPLSTSVPVANGPSSLTPAVIDNATKFGYVNNRAANLVDHKIYGARIDAGTGSLSEIAGLPLSLGGFLGYSMLDATGKYLYVPYAEPSGPTTTGYMAAFQVNATSGELTLIGSPIPTGGTQPIFALRHPSGKFLLVLNQSTGSAGSVAVFSVDANSGALTAVAGSPFDVGGPALIASFHPTKNFIYVRVSPLAGNGSLVIFNMDPTTGVLTSTGAPVVAVGQGTGFPIVEPNGKFLIVPNSNSNNIQSFSIDATTGALTQVAGSPFVTDQRPLPLRPDPSWKYYYGVNAVSNTVSSYSLDAVTGTITRISNVATGTSPGYVGLAGRQ